MQIASWFAALSVVVWIGVEQGIVKAGQVVTSTVYVGRHFEVRDHDQPVKYVFDGDTRLARVTGSLSPGSRVQRLRLSHGWNLLALAVTASNLVGQLEQSAAGARGPCARCAPRRQYLDL
jgi:hypothetical protein